MSLPQLLVRGLSAVERVWGLASVGIFEDGECQDGLNLGKLREA